MSRATFVLLFVCFVCITELTNGFLIKGRNVDGVFTRDVPIPKEDQDVADANELNIEQEIPAPEVTVYKQCAAIGEFCMNHSDCCTNACLGYMKRCVS